MLLSKVLPALAGAGAVAAVSGAGYLIASKPSLSFGGDQKPGEDRFELMERIPSRQQQLTRLRQSTPEKPFDVLIIGGGSTGTGSAVDAVTRCVWAP